MYIAMRVSGPRRYAHVHMCMGVRPCTLLRGTWWIHERRHMVHIVHIVHILHVVHIVHIVRAALGGHIKGGEFAQCVLYALHAIYVLYVLYALHAIYVLSGGEFAQWRSGGLPRNVHTRTCTHV